MSKETGRPALDHVDRGIVAMLQQNGRVPNLEMARQLGVSEATVRKRLERLLDEGIIRVRATVSPSVLGYSLHALIGVRTELSRLQDIAIQVAGLPNVWSVNLTAGTYDLLVEAVFQSHDGLETFLMRKLAAIPGVVRSETFHVLRGIKEAADWQIPDGAMEKEKMETRRTVLVVDDDPSFRAIAKAVLSKSGYQVITAVDGSDGLSKARQQLPDAIILDYMMSTPTEGSLVAWLLEEDADLRRIPVLMATAVGSEHPWWRVHPDESELPVDGWLDKPVPPDRLVAEVERLLTKKSVPVE